MSEYSVAFDRPAYLALLVVIPLLWRLASGSLAGIGRQRGWLALVLRSIVAAAIVLALADAHIRKQSNQLTVVYLLDQSLSIPSEQREAMLPFVSASVSKHSTADGRDRYAVIAFGRNASVEAQPLEAGVPPPPRIESLVDPEYTDLATAVERAQALFPADSAKRIVLVTDGNENRGDVYREARAAAAAGVSVDVVAVRLAPRTDVAIEKLDLPAGVRRGQPFDLRVVLVNDAASDQVEAVSGTLRIVRKAGEREETVAEQRVEIPPGKRVLAIREVVDRADFYSYEAHFSPDHAEADGVSQNNTLSAFAHVRGKGHVLLIENVDARGQFDFLVERLRANDLEVTVAATDQLFNSLADLQRYDCVILANVSRSTADGESEAAFTDAQIEMLVSNTRELGCGLLMLGGPDSFGAGGWANTKLEEAMPVDFQIKAAEVVQVGALALVIDRSGSMDGEKLAMSKQAAIAAIRSMGRRDYISVVAFDDSAYSIVPLRRVGDYRNAATLVETLGSGGGTDMYPGMVTAYGELRKAREAGAKHMIVLSDGQTPDAKFAELVTRMRTDKISVTSVAVGADANVPLLQQISRRGGGKFYSVLNPRALPRIFLSEVRRVARPLVYEPATPVSPRHVGEHEILDGVDGALPPIKGLVLTTVKDNPLVEVLLRSPLPAAEKNATILATWTYGAGKVAAWTTDAGRRWASAWTEWDSYDKFFTQLVRWTMRPADDGGQFTLAAHARDGRTQIVVSAVDANDEFLNSLPMAAAVVGPNLRSVDVPIVQTAPGRYVGEFTSSDPGSYYVVVNPGAGAPAIRTGVNVGYSPEFRDREVNLPLLESLARLAPTGGRPGMLAGTPLASEEDRRHAKNVAELAANPFRRDLPKVSSEQAIWPWLVVFATCLFWSDVLVRRVRLNTTWAAAAIARVRSVVFRRGPAVAPAETMRRLRSRKDEISGQLASRQAAMKFEASDALPMQRAEAMPPAIAAGAAPAPSRAGPSGAEEVPLEPTYTERLLQAKKAARGDFKRDA